MTALKNYFDTVLVRALGQAVAHVPPAVAARRISFIGTVTERSQPFPEFSEQVVNEVANKPKARFPTLREID